MSVITFQDFQTCDEYTRSVFLARAIAAHKASELYRVAVEADAYDHQRNTTICEYVKTILTATGVPVVDVTASNNKIVSNFFRRLNTQRNMYLLGNGASFQRKGLKEQLGDNFDAQLQRAGYFALIHGVSFLFWNLDRVHVFPVTEFVPLWDEDTGALGAGIRYWRLDADRPLHVVLYEADGWTKYRADEAGVLRALNGKRAYRQKVSRTAADGEEVVGEENYSALPIVPLWGSRLRQSTLVGMKSSIDSYDLIRSGFANDLSDCAQIYWILSNCGGMDDKDLSKFRERLLFRHIATVDEDGGATLTPYTQEIPYQAREAYLSGIRAGIYEDFGALDVSGITAAAKTATEINAAYQPLDENADDYECQAAECVRQILALQGILRGEDAVPQFKRNRISNELEQVQMVAMEAPYLDDETILNKLPNITPDEVADILRKKDAEALERTAGIQTPPDDGDE